jgi:hypothetical protein
MKDWGLLTPGINVITKKTTSGDRIADTFRFLTPIPNQMHNIRGAHYHLTQCLNVMITLFATEVKLNIEGAV